MPPRRSLSKILVTLAAIALLFAPAVIAFGSGWIRIPSPEHVSRHELTPIEAWVAFAVFYVFWAALVMVALVFVLDRLGFKYTPVDLPERESRRRRRRRAAGLGYLRAQQTPPSPLKKAPAKKAGTQKPAPPGGSGREQPPPDERGAA